MKYETWIDTTTVNYQKIFEELKKFDKYGRELTAQDPDANSEVWQVASNMIEMLQTIKARAIRLEKAFNKNI